MTGRAIEHQPVRGLKRAEYDRLAQLGWRSLEVFRRGERIAMLAFPDVTIDVADILPPLAAR